MDEGRQSLDGPEARQPIGAQRIHDVGVEPPVDLEALDGSRPAMISRSSS